MMNGINCLFVPEKSINLDRRKVEVEVFPYMRTQMRLADSDCDGRPPTSKCPSTTRVQSRGRRTVPSQRFWAPMLSLRLSQARNQPTSTYRVQQWNQASTELLLTLSKRCPNLTRPNRFHPYQSTSSGHVVVVDQSSLVTAPR